MLTALGLLAVAALIAANGYFVAAEFAFVAARRSRVEDLAAGGNRRARNVLAVQQRLSFMLSGAQLGITVTSLVVGFIAEGTIGAALRPLVEMVGMSGAAARGLSLSIGFALATGAQMVFGELAPKNLAIAKPEAVSLSLAGSVKVFLRLAGPLIALFDNAANGLLRLIGIEAVEDIDHAVSPEELIHIISESRRQGDLTDRQAALLARVLNFRQLRAGAVMVPRTNLVTISTDATCDDLRRLGVDTGLSRFPVVEHDADDIRGVVQAKAVLGVPPGQRSTRPVTALMREPFAVPESALLADVLREFRRRHVHIAIVVDEHGGTAGAVTLEDLLEELVGDIRDEHDLREPAVLTLPDGSYRVPGSWRLDETRRDTGVELPEGDYETLSGLVMAELGRLPETDDVIELDNARLHVERLAGHAVATLRMTPLDPAGAPHERRDRHDRRDTAPASPDAEPADGDPPDEVESR